MKSFLGMWKLEIPFSNKEEPQALLRRGGKKTPKESLQNQQSSI